VLKENKIKCSKCNESFSVKNNEFTHDLLDDCLFKQFLDDFDFLSLDEKTLKTKIESCLSKYFQLYDEFELRKSNLTTQSYNHFQELRRQIDLHREEEMPKVFHASIMNKIDEVSLAMIERVNECEAAFLVSLNENMNFTLDKSHDQELKELNETFRDPNISMDTIKQIQLKQGENVRKLKSSRRRVKGHISFK
jgi:hypothetical protein